MHVLTQTTGQCEEDQDEDPFFDPLATQISLTTGTNYQATSTP